MSIVSIPPIPAVTVSVPALSLIWAVIVLVLPGTTFVEWTVANVMIGAIPKDLYNCAGYTLLNKLNISEVLKMPTITLSVSEDLKKEMDEFKIINWSAVAREAIRDKVSELALFKSIVSKSKLSEKDAEEIGNEISESLHERYKKKYSGLV